jgi:hypothetical protein
MSLQRYKKKAEGFQMNKYEQIKQKSIEKENIRLFNMIQKTSSSLKKELDLENHNIRLNKILRRSEAVHKSKSQENRPQTAGFMNRNRKIVHRDSASKFSNRDESSDMKVISR